MDSEFDPQVDTFTHILCYEVSTPTDVPIDMIIRDVPDSNYVTDYM